MFTLFKQKDTRKSASLLQRSLEMNPILQVEEGTDFAKQIKMVDLTERDLAVAQALKPYVEHNIHEVVDQFYENLAHNSDLYAIIHEHSSIERLKKTLRRHIVEMLSGIVNEEFFIQRRAVAAKHVEIGLTQKWYIASFEKIFNGLTEIILSQFNSKEDRVLAIKVVNK